MTTSQKEWAAAQIRLNEDPPRPHACYCVGPQNGDPACPCAMRAKQNEANRAWLDGYEAGKRAAKKGTDE